MAEQGDGELPATNPQALNELVAAPLEPPVAEHGPGGPVRDHKITNTRAGQAEDRDMTRRANSNNPCNVHGAFPPSPDERQPFWSVAKTGGRRLATARRNGPSTTLPQGVGPASSRLKS